MSHPTYPISHLLILFIRLLDDQTFERLSSFELEPQEIACSILHTGCSAEAAAAAAAPAAGGSRAAALSTSGVAGASKGYLVVGTALEKPEAREPCEHEVGALAGVRRARVHVRASVHSYEHPRCSDRSQFLHD